MTFALATIRHNRRPTPAIEVDGSWYALAQIAPELLEPAPSRGLINIFEHWTEREPALTKLANELRSGTLGATELGPTPAIEQFLTPLQYPTKVVLMGANYYDHMAKDAPFIEFKAKEDKIPTLFFKPPPTTLVGCGKSVRYPAQSEKFDWEGELAAVIGKRARRVSPAEALDYVAGYAVGIDLSARDWQFHPKHLVKFDLFGGKGFDDSCPFGPKITPAQFVQHDRLQLKLWVNGDLKQNANTSDMIWSLGEQVSAISDHVTLEPGDVILTGTPAGVGLASRTFLKIGDKVDAEIEGLGRLSIEIIADQPFASFGVSPGGTNDG
jgi:2-keto-4-pentenoate hydratase/2-oxohepta-3-ene-1,7-dioic acid hydratase in catechol pathway